MHCNIMKNMVNMAQRDAKLWNADKYILVILVGSSLGYDCNGTGCNKMR